MVFILFIAVLVHSQSHPGNKLEKFKACTYLTRLKFPLIKDQFTQFVQAEIPEEKIGKRVSLDLLYKCYRSIDEDTAMEVLAKEGQNLEMTDKFEAFLDLDYESYKESDFELTAELQEFLGTIKIKEKDAEFPNSRIWHILLLAGSFGGLFYWLRSYVLRKPEKLGGKDKNN